MTPIRIEKARVRKGSTWQDGEPSCLIGHVMAALGIPAGTNIEEDRTPALDFLRNGVDASPVWFDIIKANYRGDNGTAAAIFRAHGVPVELI